ncbi:probable disease resistance protein At5g63020 [Cornus florida]|uniref:probable disease resistance protein At5g63020 n=1 Tax=Cornus florida TaxID=4283 RepID=UPI002897220C|nr:probable disease resistance protein At5g63020 [Cornus florida]
MDFVSPILDVTCRLCGCIGNTTNYIRHLQHNLNSLSSEMQTLRAQRNDVNIKIEAAEGPLMKRTEQIVDWLGRVEELEREVEVLLQLGAQEIQKKCLRICPRNCLSSHKLGKKVCQKLQAVSDMKSEGNNIPVVVTLPRARAEEMPLETTVGLDSNVDKVLNFLRDDGVGIIGIYGMGGVGKTTLLKKLNNELATQLSTGEFDEVIWIVVSKDLVVEKVQDEIGEKLGFPDETWSNKSQHQKREAIFRVLKQKKFVLLLDDIWERLDLLQVGVPLPNSENKAKVVFTTRSEQLCGLMEVQKKIKVECLMWQKAWDLFQRKVGEETLNSHPAIRQLAEVVCKECAGLPLALITIGRAMSTKKTPQEWNYAISVLKKSTSQFSGMGDKVLPLLKFSYDSLCDETIRTCFLYCSFLPEDVSITKVFIITSWIGEGLLDECDNIDEAFSLGHDIIGRLKLACLLECSKKGSNDFKMHDVIRDMALWILLESGRKYLVQAGLKLSVTPALSKWEETEKISLMENCIEELSGTPRCPNLLTLNIRRNPLRTISNNFFQFMPALKVLDLSLNKYLTNLPASLFLLFSLQHLDLSGTSIRELPIEFKSLAKLKYLFMKFMRKLEIIPPQVISNLSMLQILEMNGSGVSKRTGEGSILIGGHELLLDELECLNHLQYLSLTVKSEAALQKLSSSHKLRSCTFHLDIEQYRGGSTSLQMSSLEKNMKRLETLEIRNCDGLEELLMDWIVPNLSDVADGTSMDWMSSWEDEERERAVIPYKDSPPNRSFHSLETVYIWRCKVLKDLTWLISAPNLHFVSIYYCDAMEEVIKDMGCSSSSEISREGSLSGFSKLQRLYLDTLPKLKSIYTHPLPFPSLTTIRVRNCPKLDKLPFDSNTAKHTLQSIQCHREWWDKLEWYNEETRSVFVPLFKCVSD